MFRLTLSQSSAGGVIARGEEQAAQHSGETERQSSDISVHILTLCLGSSLVIAQEAYCRK